MSTFCKDVVTMATLTYSCTQTQTEGRGDEPVQHEHKRTYTNTNVCNMKTSLIHITHAQNYATPRPKHWHSGPTVNYPTSRGELTQNHTYVSKFTLRMYIFTRNYGSKFTLRMYILSGNRVFPERFV